MRLSRSISRPRAQTALAIVAITSALSFTACVTDSCACVTVPNEHQERWTGLSPLRDSLDLSLFVVIGGSANGNGTVSRADGSTRPITVTGQFDQSVSSPGELTFTGWFDEPVKWTSTTRRSDSLYGIVRLPAGIRVGDTLGLSLYRRR